MEDQLLLDYERSVAALIAHASIHAPHAHDESLRELILRGERSLCDRCLGLRDELVSAAEVWRTAATRGNVLAGPMPAFHDATAAHLGLAG